MDPVEEIKKRIDIVDFINGYVPLKKAGLNFKGLCPFHQEKSPSFMVNRERQSWHCFGCNEGGDVISFLEKIDNLNFVEATKILAERAGVEFRLNRGFDKDRQDKALLFEVMEAATKFYEETLNSAAGREAREYLIKRGLNSESVAFWRLGFAADAWDKLTQKLLSQKFRPEELERAGLTLPGKRGPYDRFRNRIIFPIFDLSGKVTAFSGRALGEVEPKYLNSPETPIFKKGNVLFGLDKARQAVRNLNSAVLVEGNFDLILSHQFGFKNLVAPCGTALTLEQLSLLSRYTDNVSFAFDADKAGQAAAFKAAVMAYQVGLSPRIVKISAGKDPADMMLSERAGFTEAVENADFALTYFLASAVKSKTATSPAGKKEVVKLLLPLLRAITDPVEKADSIQMVSDRLRISLNSLEKAIGENKEEELATASVYTTISPIQIVIGLLYKYEIKPPQLPRILELSNDKTIKFLAGISTKEFSWQAYKQSVSRKMLLRLNELAQIVEEAYPELSKKEAEREVNEILSTLKERRKEAIKKAFIFKIRDAERRGDREEIKKLVLKLASLNSLTTPPQQ